MVKFGYDKKVIVKRYIKGELGKFNRPNREPSIVGTYDCKVAQQGSSTSQLLPQKLNTTSYDLFTEPTANISKGDLLLIYEVDEYGKIITASEVKAVVEKKPYKTRTQLRVGLNEKTEV